MQIAALRRVLDKSGTRGSCIQTIRGRGYRLTVAVTRIAADAVTASRNAGLMLPDKPSLAVIPFQNMSGDPEQEYFADGMVEEIITALSRISWLFVIARNSSFTYKAQAVDVKQVGRELGVRYVLEGAVRKAGGRVRISAQLIDATTGAHLWADRFDGLLEDVFELQDKVAVSVAGVIEPTLEAAETRRLADRPTHDLTALDFYLRALPDLDAFGKTGLLRALDLLGQAIERDPHYGPALALAAHCHQGLEVNGWAEDPEATRHTSVDFARQALRSAPDDPNVLALTAFVLGYFGEDIDVSLALIDRCLVLNPSHARGWHWSALLRIFAGQPELALEQFATYLRLSPRDRMATYLNGIGEAYFLQPPARRGGGKSAGLARPGANIPGDLPRPRLLLRAYGTARRSARDRRAAARDHACRDGARHALPQPGTSRAFFVRSAVGRQSGGLTHTRRPRRVAVGRPAGKVSPAGAIGGSGPVVFGPSRFIRPMWPMR